MKKLIALACMCVFALGVSAQEKKVEKAKTSTQKPQKGQKSPKAQKPTVEFKTLVIERNDIAYGADETFTFEFKNNGKTPVIVSNVQTSCGCTTAEKPTEPVQAKKTGKISVKYDTKRVGPFTKTITVTTNVGEPIVLTIKGKVGEKPTEN